MAKKRPTLDAFLGSQAVTSSAVSTDKIVAEKPKQTPAKTVAKKPAKKEPVSQSVPVVEENVKHEVIRHMLYLPLPVYDQLQGLIFEEQRGQTKRRKTHDYLLDAIDLLFKEKGLKSISELVHLKGKSD